MFQSYLLKRKALLQTAFLSAFLLTFSSVVEAASAEVVKNTKVFKLELGATRLIYHPGERGVLLSVNNQQNFPVLVQSRVFNEDRATQAPFMVTPPLFRLDPNQRNTLRVISTGSPVSGKESLYWLCVTGIPPKSDDVWANDNIPQHAQVNMEISTHMCIKLITRPTDIKGNMMQAAETLQWSREGNAIKTKNNSPYYINLLSLSVGGKTVEELDYIPPFAERTFNLNGKPEGAVNWTVITDAGGASRQFSTTM